VRTNIVIDEALMQNAMRGAGFKTKKEAVEEGLRLLARRNHYREVLKWEGRLLWDDQPASEVVGTPKKSSGVQATARAKVRRAVPA
jgi:antitoxin ParD1/3/4